MRVPQKADYALRAMVELAAHEGASLRSATIAERAGIPDKYLEAILVELGRAGLVASRRGPEGGHRLARPAREITAAAIYAAVDGSLRLAPARVSAHPSATDLALGELWSGLERAASEVLESTTLEDLRRRTQDRRNVLDFSI